MADGVLKSNQELESEVAECAHSREAVRERGQRFRSLVEQTLDALVVVDEDGRIIAVLRSLGEVRPQSE